MKKLKDYETNMITYRDEKYNVNLRTTENFPVCLFYKGNIELLNERIIAIIGNREYSEYGKKVALNFAYQLSKQNIIVVTGGARGIDSFANLGAIYAQKPSIIVLGNGLNHIYPPENKELEEKVLHNDGLIITEYFNNEVGNKHTFPERNRIISSISKGVLVIEAKKKSGTMITVDFALDQGKEIYVIPGDINKENSKGTNNLIKQGAKMVTCIDDILEDFL